MSPTIHYTPREIAIIRLLLLGNFRKMIGSILNLSSGYVNNRIKQLYEKIDCHSMEELLIYLLSNGFSVNRERTTVTFHGEEI
jgi:DNA-binding NarL/FixJ family response regulator